MSYILFDRVTSKITSVTYNKPTNGNFIQVDQKTCNDFLSGKVATTQYKVTRRRHGSPYELLPLNEVCIPQSLIEKSKEKIIKTSTFQWYISKKEQCKSYTKLIYDTVLDFFNPYTSIPGEFYINKLLGLRQPWKNTEVSNIKNICVAPWVHMHTWPNNKVLPCCLTPMEDTIGDLTDSSLMDVWNGQPLRDMRLQFLNNERPMSCHRCFSIEDAGGLSYRNHLNVAYDNEFKVVQDTHVDGTVDKLNLKYWDFRFSNICNFKCRTCGPQLSSGWYEDTERLYGELPKNLPNPQYVRTKPTWNELLPLFDIVEEIYFVGGEPLIMEEHYKILNKLVDLKRFDVALSYNTNFSRMKYKKMNVLDIWPLFDSVRIGASIDAMGPQAEFLRSGTKWEQIVENRNQMIEKSPKSKFYTNITLGNMNSYHVVEFYKWIVDNKFIEHPKNIHLNLVQFPKHYTLQALPKECKKVLTEEYNNLAEYCEANKVATIADQWKMAINYMNEEDIWEQERNTFRNITKNLDKVREEKFVNVFPELESMMK